MHEDGFAHSIIKSVLSRYKLGLFHIYWWLHHSLIRETKPQPISKENNQEQTRPLIENAKKCVFNPAFGCDNCEPRDFTLSLSLHIENRGEVQSSRGQSEAR